MAQKEWRHRNLVREQNKVRLRRKARRELLARLKAGPCMDCGRSFPSVCMDFDHREPEKKKADVAHMVNSTPGLQAFMEEIAKCDLVCSNCHRIRTEKRRTGREH